MVWSTSYNPGLLAGSHRAEHPDAEPDLNFKKAKAEKHGEQPKLL